MCHIFLALFLVKDFTSFQYLFTVFFPISQLGLTPYWFLEGEDLEKWYLHLQDLALGNHLISICGVGELVNESKNDYWKILTWFSPQTLIHLFAIFRFSPGRRKKTRFNHFLRLPLAFILKSKLYVFLLFFFYLAWCQIALSTPEKSRMIIYTFQNKIIKNPACFLICVFSSAAENASLLSSAISATEDNSNAWLMDQGK